MSRNTIRHQRGWNISLSVVAALVALVLVAFSGPAFAATPGNSGKSNGQSGEHGNKNGHDKQEKHGNSGGNSSQGGPGNKSNGKSGGNGHSNAGGQGNGNAAGNSSHGNREGNGHQSGNSGNSGGHGNSGGGKGDPAGNNGTVKIDGVDFDTAPNNEPHPGGCSVQIDFYGFDKGDLSATVTFADHSPTSDGGLTVTSGQGNPSSVFIGEDAASGGGSEAGLDAQETYKFAFTGVPHPKQGYHVKLTVNAPGSKGADTKHKVFWVNEECGSQPPPSDDQCPDGTNPGDTDGDGDEDADDCVSTPPPPDDQCPDGTNPGDVDGDGDEDADDCEVLGPPPSSNPLGSLAVNCKGVVTVKLDNRKSTIDRDYYLEREMDATAAQAWKFTVPAGEVRITTRHGSTGDVFTLSTDDKGLGSVTVPTKCGDTPDNPDNLDNSIAPGVPTTVNSGLAPAITAVSHLSGVSLWGVMLGLGALLAGGAVMLRRRLG